MNYNILVNLNDQFYTYFLKLGKYSTFSLKFLMNLSINKDPLLQSIWSSFTVKYANESIADCHYTASTIEFIRYNNTLNYGRLQIIPSNFFSCKNASPLKFVFYDKNSFLLTILDYSILYSG